MKFTSLVVVLTIAVMSVAACGKSEEQKKQDAAEKAFQEEMKRMKN